LPPGDWFDFWTHTKIPGEKFIQATNGVGQVPLFAKSGTLLPLAEPVEFVKADTCFNLTVHTVGEKPADFTLYEDDGVTTAYAKGEQNKIQLHAEGENHSIRRNGNYHGPERYKITGWNQF
jgi:alpha-D-xyloside xylohydrolase